MKFIDLNYYSLCSLPAKAYSDLSEEDWRSLW